MADEEQVGRRRSIAIGAGLVLVVSLPILVALAALHSPRWFPIGDLAQTELRVREVGTGDTPLVGLAGRIGPADDPGHHPGPLSFYALAPVYRLAGSSPFALQVSTGLLNIAAIGLAVWISMRRAGALGALGVSAALSVLVCSLGPRVVTEPWNPYLPVMWWAVVLLALWSVWCDDDALLPVAVGAACLAAQTHVPYAGLAVVVVGATVLRLLWRAVRARRHRASAAPRWGWVGVAVTVGVVAWIPPIIDELRGDPGNLTILARYFLGNEGEPVGWRAGGELWLSRLDPWTLVTHPLDGPTSGNRVAGAVFLLVWALAAAVAWRRRDQALVRLHTVVALAALGGLVSMSRIYGQLLYYLVLWAWPTLALAIVAVVATFGRALVADLRGPALAAPLRTAAATRSPGLVAAVALPVVVLVGAVGVGTVRAADATQSSSVYSETLGHLVAPTVAALRAGDVPGGGTGAYEVRSDDPYVIGVQSYGLFTELLREGIDARLPRYLRSTAGPHVTPDDQTDQLPVIVVATGPRVKAWQDRTDAVEVASADPRTPAERAEQARLVARVQADLRALGRDDEADQVEQNLLLLGLDADLPDHITKDIQRIIDLGAPTAVFVAPPAP